METHAPRRRAAAVLAGLFAVLPLLLSSGRYGDDPRALILLHPEDPQPGHPVTVAVSLSRGDAADMEEGTTLSYRAALISADGRRIASVPLFVLEKGVAAAAVLAVPNTAAPGPAVVRIEGLPAGAAEQALVIRPRDFTTEEIRLDEANTAIRTEPDPRKTAESAELWRVLSATVSDVFHGGAFLPPTEATRRTSRFGDRRLYRYADGSVDRSIHAGIDYGIPRGSAVAACAAGRVVMAKYRIVTGYTVVVAHLPGVYSLYYHLDSLAAAEGNLVAPGDILGVSGSTGLSTGPHLHWEIRIHGEPADPDALVAGAVLDKGFIISKMAELADTDR